MIACRPQEIGVILGFRHTDKKRGHIRKGVRSECHEVKPYSLVWLDLEVTRASDTMALSHNLWER